MKRKTRSETTILGVLVNALVQEGKTYQEVADRLKLNSPQIARYHFLRYRRLNSKVEVKETNKP